MRANEGRPLGTDSIELSGIVSMVLSQRLQFRNCTSVGMPAAVEHRFRVTLLTTSVPQVVLGITFFVCGELRLDSYLVVQSFMSL